MIFNVFIFIHNSVHVIMEFIFLSKFQSMKIFHRIYDTFTFIDFLVLQFFNLD
jgi:hypothetical protein